MFGLGLLPSKAMRKVFFSEHIGNIQYKRSAYSCNAIVIAVFHFNGLCNMLYFSPFIVFLIFIMYSDMNL